MLSTLLAVPPWVWLTAAVILLFLLWRLAATRTRRSNARRGAVARRAERAAERLLRRHGYDVIARQAAGRLDLLVDGRPASVACRADLLVVERGGRRLVAEVKSGGPVTLPTHPSTRRQLLEYRLAFDVDGVLLVDMTRRRVRVVAFPQLAGLGASPRRTTTR